MNESGNQAESPFRSVNALTSQIPIEPQGPAGPDQPRTVRCPRPALTVVRSYVGWGVCLCWWGGVWPAGPGCGSVYFASGEGDRDGDAEEVEGSALGVGGFGQGGHGGAVGAVKEVVAGEGAQVGQ